MTKKLSDYNSIVCSIHLNNNLFNVWDYLSAKWLSYIYGVDNIIWLPEHIKNNIWNCIYWWWWMIRPNFYNREVYKHFLSIQWKHSIVWVWLNKDKQSIFEYTKRDYQALFNWINNAEYVSVRDKATYDFIKYKLYNWKLTRILDINSCPSYIYLKKIKQKNIVKEYKYWIVPSFWHTKWYLPYVDSIKTMIDNFIQEEWWKNILLLCHDKNDLKFSEENFPDINSVLIKEFDDVINNYSLCKWIITVRAHWIIFSASLKINCSYIYLADKLKTLYEHHYWMKESINEVIFDINYHKKKLEKNIYPLNK
jgi:hypothetical protein